MSVTTEPAFYDEAMTAPHEPAMLPLEDSPWLELYQRASWMIPPSHPVVDLGCGTGRFAEQLRRRGHGPYLGLDFSAAAVAECKRYVPAHDSDTDWHGRFEVCDLREWRPDPVRAGATVYTCLETLEHLEDDVDLVQRVPAGHQFVFSVPTYGGEAHLRVFPDPAVVWRRYGHLVELTAWARIGAGPRYFIHLFNSMRRGDAW